MYLQLTPGWILTLHSQRPPTATTTTASSGQYVTARGAITAPPTTVSRSLQHAPAPKALQRSLSSDVTNGYRVTSQAQTPLQRRASEPQSRGGGGGGGQATTAKKKRRSRCNSALPLFCWGSRFASVGFPTICSCRCCCSCTGLVSAAAFMHVPAFSAGGKWIEVSSVVATLGPIALEIGSNFSAHVTKMSEKQRRDVTLLSLGSACAVTLPRVRFAALAFIRFLLVK